MIQGVKIREIQHKHCIRVTHKLHTADIRGCEILGFWCDLSELFRLLRCYVAQVGLAPKIFGTTYRSHLQSFFLDSLSLEDVTDT